MYEMMLLLVHLQTTINEIQQQMNDHYQKNTSLREENLELANKLKGLIEQYELREEVCFHVSCFFFYLIRLANLLKTCV